jgi:hypothetical protein
MTIREFLMRRSSQYTSRTMAFLLVSGALVSIGASAFVVRFVCAVMIVVVTVAAFWSLFQIPCPKCHKSLGLVGFKVANSGTGGRNTVPAHCPHCNVSFDEPMP